MQGGTSIHAPELAAILLFLGFRCRGLRRLRRESGEERYIWAFPAHSDDNRYSLTQVIDKYIRMQSAGEKEIDEADAIGGACAVLLTYKRLLAAMPAAPITQVVSVDGNVVVAPRKMPASMRAALEKELNG